MPKYSVDDLTNYANLSQYEFGFGLKAEIMMLFSHFYFYFYFSYLSHAAVEMRQVHVKVTR